MKPRTATRTRAAERARALLARGLEELEHIGTLDPGERQAPLLEELHELAQVAAIGCDGVGRKTLLDRDVVDETRNGWRDSDKVVFMAWAQSLPAILADPRRLGNRPVAHAPHRPGPGQRGQGPAEIDRCRHRVLT